MEFNGCYAKGRADYFAGLGAMRNLYPIGTENAKQWAQGWEDAAIETGELFRDI